MHFRILGVGVLTFPCSSSPRCSCEKQPVLGALPLAEPNVDNAAPGSSGAFSFPLRPLCRPSFFCPGGSCWSAAPSFPLTAFLLWPSPSRRGPRTVKGGLIDHLTCSSSVFIHPSGSTFSLTPLFFFTTLNLHSSFRRNNGVVLSCTLCGEICSAIYLSITYPSLGLFSI